MSNQITVASPLLTEVGAVPLTPAQRAAVWEIAAVLDERHVPAPDDPTTGDAVWIEVSAARLRGSWGRNDNVWLRELLRRLEGVRFGGRAGTDDWGGVLVAQWKITSGGSVVELLIPPAGLAALRTPGTFAKIDQEAAHRLPHHARTLYGLIADKQRQKVRRWAVSVEQLKGLLGVADKYIDRKTQQPRFDNFRRYALDPAVRQINDFAVIRLDYDLERLGRRVDRIIFRWDLKDPAAATRTAQENERHSCARGKRQDTAGAPPLIRDQALRWLRAQNVATRSLWANRARERGAERALADPDSIGGWIDLVAEEIVQREGLDEGPK